MAIEGQTQADKNKSMLLILGEVLSLFSVPLTQNYYWHLVHSVDTKVAQVKCQVAFLVHFSSQKIMRKLLDYGNLLYARMKDTFWGLQSAWQILNDKTKILLVNYLFYWIGCRSLLLQDYYLPQLYRPYYSYDQNNLDILMFTKHKVFYILSILPIITFCSF